MKRSIFNALPIVAAHYANKFGIEVKVGGSDAHTDGNIIQIPAIPDHYPHLGVVWGYLAHQAARCRFTNFDLIGGYSPFKNSLVNIFEDIQIEKSMMTRYPGVVFDLNNTVEYLVATGKFKSFEKDESLASILTKHLQYVMRSAILHQPCSELAKQSELVMAEVFPASVGTAIDVIMRQARNIDSTLSAVQMADRVIQIINDIADEEEEKDSQQQNEDGSQPDSGVGISNSASTHPSIDDECNGTETLSEKLRQMLISDTGDLPSDAMMELGNEFIDASDKQSNDDNVSIACQLSEGSGFYCGNNRAALDLIEKARATTYKIKSQLVGLVQSSQNKGIRTGFKGRHFNSSKLSRVMSGDFRIFKERIDKQHPDTAVHILTDLSSSMENCYEVAQQASLALALALEAIPGVVPALTYFGNDEHNPIHVAVRFGSSVMSQLNTIAAKPTGNTPMAEAIWYAAFRLSTCRQKRKIIIVITDGKPNHRSEKKTHTAIDLCINANIEMIGIGIGVESVADYFENHIVINDVSDLQNTLFTLMQNKLIAA